MVKFIVEIPDNEWNEQVLGNARLKWALEDDGINLHKMSKARQFKEVFGYVPVFGGEDIDVRHAMKVKEVKERERRSIK